MRRSSLRTALAAARQVFDQVPERTQSCRRPQLTLCLSPPGSSPR
uniref:Uncharacterized protein n=1 Tax=Arundo donax TaxID=35708 RepID=A0A0A9BHK8_ARUDO